MEIDAYLDRLREADHMVASMPRSAERTSIQKAIGKRLKQITIILQVESAKDPSVESESRH